MNETVSFEEAVDLYCKVCGNPIAKGRGGPAPTYCSSRCRVRHHRGAEDYAAKDIKILTEHEVWTEFDWAKIGALSEKYRKDAGWIERGIKSCEAAGVSSDYFIHRYLDGDKSIPLHEGVDEAFRELFMRQYKPKEK